MVVVYTFGELGSQRLFPSGVNWLSCALGFPVGVSCIVEFALFGADGSVSWAPVFPLGVELVECLRSRFFPCVGCHRRFVFCAGHEVSLAPFLSFGRELVEY